MKRSERGFTLMETLLAAALFVAVAASSYGIFSLGLQIWKRVRGQTATERKIVLALEKMGKEIRTTPKTEPVRDEIGKDEIEYGGAAGEFSLPGIIRFRSRQGAWLTQYGKITYRFDSRKGELCRQAQSAADLFAERQVPCVPVASKITQLRFRYWIKDTVSRSYSWYDEWTGREGFPEAVRVEFRTSSPGAVPRGPARVKDWEATWIVAATGAVKP